MVSATEYVGHVRTQLLTQIDHGTCSTHVSHDETLRKLIHEQSCFILKAFSNKPTVAEGIRCSSPRRSKGT